MKSITALILAAAGLAGSIAAADGADSIFIVIDGSAETELRPSISAVSPGPAVTAEKNSVPARKVRVVLQSPYGN